MDIVGVEERLLNASIYIKNAILELQNIPCRCTDNDYCDRCRLIDNTKNLRECINEEISKLLNFK